MRFFTTSGEIGDGEAAGAGGCAAAVVAATISASIASMPFMARLLIGPAWAGPRGPGLALAQQGRGLLGRGQDGLERLQLLLEQGHLALDLAELGRGHLEGADLLVEGLELGRLLLPFVDGVRPVEVPERPAD